LLEQIAALQQTRQAVLDARPILAAGWAVRATPMLQAQFIAATPTLRAVYTEVNLSPLQVAVSIQQLREIYQRAQQLRENHPNVDVITLAMSELVTPDMGDARWVENFRFIESHRKAVTNIHVHVTALPAVRPVMNVIDSTDPPAGSGGISSAPPLRVLFIGNSLTYINDIPAQFRQVAAAGLHRRIVTRMITLPGVALHHLWQGGRGVAVQVLRSQPWDAVVLQGRPERANLPVVARSDVAHAIAAFDTLRIAALAQAFQHESQAQHARFFLDMPSQGDEDAFLGEVMDSLYTRIGRIIGASVVHTSRVVDRVKTTSPALRPQLFLPGGGHQSAMGAYLHALVIYTTLTQHSSVGLPHPVLPGLTDSIAMHFQQVVTRTILPDSVVSAVSESHAWPAPSPVVVELYTDQQCATCATAQQAVAAVTKRDVNSAAHVIPLIWPVHALTRATPTMARTRLAAALAHQVAGAKAVQSPDTTALTLPALLVDGVPTTVSGLSQAVARAARRSHPWITATYLGGTHCAMLLVPDSSASSADSVDIWTVVTEDSPHADIGPTPHAIAAVVRAAHLLKTASVQAGTSASFAVPTIPSDVVKARIHLYVLVQHHHTGQIVSAAEVPLPFYTEDQR
jgi:hypothetical protein